MSKVVGNKIGHALGGIVDIVIPENGSKEGRYMRLKVMINITKPLPRACVQRAEDVRLGNLKYDQFGTWLKAENHVIFSKNQRRQGVNTTEGRTTVRNQNSTPIEGTRDVGTSEQLGLWENESHGVGQNESKGKQKLGWNGKDDELLNIVESHQMQLMEVLNYGQQEMKFTGVRVVLQQPRRNDVIFDKENMSLQMPVDANMCDDTAKEKREYWTTYHEGVARNCTSGCLHH
ncbi:hypothetical protein RND71_004789 [Anisodus tanguticus]|uniref:Uncharacterized protein n=1 Tax=Anisodus tanguticus TaxID=243964 RepID=A0AAE1SQ85_9SOLA|nr:hypothetical protein RND71_004789 [Anisodus tanguticus]